MVLIAIGILIIQGKRLFSRLMWFDRISLVVPVLSAVVLLGIGVWLTFGALGNVTGSLADLRNPATTSSGQEFNIQQAQVIFVTQVEGNHDQLFTVPASGGMPRQITYFPAGVIDFSVSPDYSSVVFSFHNDLSNVQVYQLRLENNQQVFLVDCEKNYCGGFNWNQNGNLILYNRLDYDLETNPSGVSTIWWLNRTTKETEPLFQEAQMPGYSPRWSSNGEWLSYLSINPQEIKIFHIESGESQSLSTQTGMPAVWSPDSTTLLMIDIVETEGRYLPRLHLYDIRDQRLSLLFSDPNIDESYPTWSPSGEWIALTRREWDADPPQQGNQIWLVRPDGTDGHAITMDENVYHGQPTWSPDGEYLIYEVIQAGGEVPLQGIEMINLETKEVTLLAAPGNSPAWLP